MLIEFQKILLLDDFVRIYFLWLKIDSWIAVQKFNAMNRWYKRGLSLVPIKYGFTLPGQMQSAMVQILAEDGTVVLSHSGAEVGQGLTTKVMQCVSYALGVPLSMIVCRPTSTDKIPNFTVTGGSSTSESVCQVGSSSVELDYVQRPFDLYIQTASCPIRLPWTHARS